MRRSSTRKETERFAALLLALLLAAALPAQAFAEENGWELTFRIPDAAAVWPGESGGPDDVRGELRQRLEDFSRDYLEAVLRYASGVAFEDGYRLRQMTVPGTELQERISDLGLTYGFLRTLSISLLSVRTLRCGQTEPGQYRIDLETRIESTGFQGAIQEVYRMRLLLRETDGELKAEGLWPSSPDEELDAVECRAEGETIRFFDTDGDGLILVPVSGACFNGYLLAVSDPLRIKLGFSPDDVFGRGFTIAEFGEKFGAVAVINGGGFDDNDGSVPERLVVRDGVMYCGGLGIGGGFAGLDSRGVLQVGFTHPDQIAERDIREGCGFGPVLIENGEIVPGLDGLNLNPRTAIAQTQDGTILMLVVEGRRGTSFGATFEDLAGLLYAFGAVTADNLDGGYSSLLWMNGAYVNNRSFVTEIRECPTSFIVLPKN